MRYYPNRSASFSVSAPKKVPENPDKCVVVVTARLFGPAANDRTICASYQCNYKRGHGPDGLYCKQHAKMLVEGKRIFVPEDKSEEDQ